MTRFATKTILFAAVAAVPVLGFSLRADAQQRLASDGRLMDASNRVGSNGINPADSDRRAPDAVTGNDVITGNVTGGRHFRGTVPYRDPREFRGATSGRQFDDFVRESSGPDSRLAETVMPFYGQGRGVAPPPGFVEATPGSGAFIPARAPVTRDPGDQRLGVVNLTEPYATLPQPGQLMLPGPVDPSGGQSYITASSLTGIQQITTQERIGTITNTQYNPVTNRLDAAAIQRMREEMNREAGVTGEAGEGEAETQKDPAAPGARAGAQPLTGEPVQKALDAAQPLDSGKARDTRMTTAIDPSQQQSVRQRLITKPIPPEQQSSVYAQLLQRHQQSLTDQTMTDEEAARAFRQAQAAQPGEPGQPGAVAQAPAATPGAAPAAPGAPAAPTAPGAPSPTPKADPDAAESRIPDFAKRGEELLKEGVPEKKVPVKVPSLSQGVKGKGLQEILKNAEDLMKEGKFTSALDQYDQAEQVAPNNPLIKLGRANAELGAAYYARAEAHLRDVLSQNPELLSGQYDLTAMLGEQRMAGLIRDLKEIANKEQREARPVFLLAYIYYNTGDIQRADGYVDLADKRSGGKDPFFKLLRDHWALPEKPAEQPAAPAPPVDANK